MKSTFISLIIYFGLLFLFFQSCITQQKCNERFPPQLSDTIRTTECDTILKNVHDTTYIDGEVIFSQRHDTIWRTQLRTMVLRDTIIQQKTVRVVDDRTKTSPPITTFVVHWYDEMCRWIAGILLLFIAGIIVGKLLKSKFPL